MRAQRIELLKKARDIAATVEGAARDFTADERADLEKAVNESAAIGEQMKSRTAAAKAVSDIGELLSQEQAGELNGSALQDAGRKAVGSLGTQFSTSEQYKAMLARHTVGGRIPDTAKGISTDRIQVAGGIKGLVASGDHDSTSGSNLLFQNQNLGLVAGLPYQAPKLRNLVTGATTTSDRVEYAQAVELGGGGTTNAASTVKEATTAGDSTTIEADTGTGVITATAVSGAGVKPESTLAFRKATADVVTIAHWMPVTKRSLSDAGQIRSIIDSFLARGIDAEVDRLILKGNKDTPVGEEEFDGILNTTGVQTQSFATDLATTIRKAITKATSKGAIVSAVLLSPEEDETLDLMRETSNGRFYGNGPFGAGPSTVWGRPRVIVEALSAEDKFILGDLSQCVLWDREQTTITATDAHADFFIRNLVAVLAEARAAFGIFNPSMLVVGSVS